jgi:hypothetical protein
VTEPEDSLAGIIEILKEPADLKPGLAQRVMAEIERLPVAVTPVSQSPPRWWRRYWTIRLTPLGGLAAAAAVALLVLGLERIRRPDAAMPALFAVHPDSGRLTQFVLLAPEASAVAVVGDFNDWSMSATPLVRSGGDGLWYVALPLSPGRYRYAFVVNGSTWRNDPEAPSAEDEFGRANSVLTVGGT